VVREFAVAMRRSGVNGVRLLLGACGGRYQSLFGWSRDSSRVTYSNWTADATIDSVQNESVLTTSRRSRPMAAGARPYWSHAQSFKLRGQLMDA